MDPFRPSIDQYMIIYVYYPHLSIRVVIRGGPERGPKKDLKLDKNACHPKNTGRAWNKCSKPVLPKYLNVDLVHEKVEIKNAPKNGQNHQNGQKRPFLALKSPLKKALFWAPSRPSIYQYMIIYTYYTHLNIWVVKRGGPKEGSVKRPKNDPFLTVKKHVKNTLLEDICTNKQIIPKEGRLIEYRERHTITKKGPKRTQKWPFFSPFLPPKTPIFGPFWPQNDPFLTPFWPIFDHYVTSI